MVRQNGANTKEQTLQQSDEVTVTVNTKYKDTVFRMLFSDKKNLLSLYNALNGRDYRDPDLLDIVTLDSAIYMGVKNDLAFILDCNMFLWEHQSTYNPNIPLRDLIYIAKEYQKYVKQKKISLYSTRQQRLPAPRFIVFYNGQSEVEDRFEQRLSDAYENFSGEPELELKVTVLNINEGHNKKLMEQCRILREYAIFVARVRKHQKLVPVKAAIEQAVQECIQEGILREFLVKNRAEVIEMSILEYNQKEEEELIRREEKEIGKEIGIQIGEERERKNTERERRRADSEKMRADSAEKENQRLRELLRENGIL